MWFRAAVYHNGCLANRLSVRVLALVADKLKLENLENLLLLTALSDFY
jgi:hypothetical protein